MKYRRLTKEEFEELHEEFIMFLSANTITGDDWKKIVAEDVEKADALMDMFSDIAFEKVLAQSKYVQRLSAKEIMVAEFGETSAHMIILRSTAEDIPNNLSVEDIKKALESKAFEIFQGSKTYQKLREQEMYELVQQGASFADGKIYQQLKSIL